MNADAGTLAISYGVLSGAIAAGFSATGLALAGYLPIMFMLNPPPGQGSGRVACFISQCIALIFVGLVASTAIFIAHEMLTRMWQRLGMHPDWLLLLPLCMLGARGRTNSRITCCRLT